jgi:uncharacterized membrane protein YhaH (DUF805 family)
MGSISIVHLAILFAQLCFVVVSWIAVVRILNRTGYSGWWSLLGLIPIVNVIALWIFSKAKWPRVDAR